MFGIAPALAAEIVFENDERNDMTAIIEVEICGPLRSQFEQHRRWVRVTVENAEAQRWQRMRAWVAENIAAPAQGESKHGN